MTEVERRALAELVARLIGAPGGPAAAPAPDPAAPPPAELPVDAVRRHLLGPLAHAAGVPGFRADYIAAALQADRRGRDLDEAIAALRDAGVEVALLKGAAYAGTLYTDPGHRPMSDVDLLVRAADFERAAAVLRRLGYWRAGAAEQLTVTRHAVTYKRRDAAVDLHRHLVQAGRTSIDLDQVWRDARPSHLAGALRPAPAHEYLLHVAHMGRHELAVPLINFVDAARLRTALTAADRSGLPALARRWRIGRALAAVEQIGSALAAATWDRGRVWPAGPTTREVLDGETPRRSRQIVRKFAMIDDPRGAAALIVAAMRAWLAARRGREP